MPPPPHVSLKKHIAHSRILEKGIIIQTVQFPYPLWNMSNFKIKMYEKTTLREIIDIYGYGY